jgi:hypothetical protein
LSYQFFKAPPRSIGTAAARFCVPVRHGTHGGGSRWRVSDAEVLKGVTLTRKLPPNALRAFLAEETPALILRASDTRHSSPETPAECAGTAAGRALLSAPPSPFPLHRSGPFTFCATRYQPAALRPRAASFPSARVRAALPFPLSRPPPPPPCAERRRCPFPLTRLCARLMPVAPHPCPRRLCHVCA